MDQNSEISNTETLHISLIVDEDNKTRIDFDINDDVDNICKSVCERYFLNSETASRLNNVMKQFVREFKERKKNKLVEENNKKINNAVNRLFYVEAENKKVKEKIRKQKREIEVQHFIDKFSFTPKINFKSNLYVERKHEKIEEKLIKDGEIAKEKLMLKKIKKSLQDKEKFISCYNRTKISHPKDLKLNLQEKINQIQPDKFEKIEITEKRIPNFFIPKIEEKIEEGKDPSFREMSEENKTGKFKSVASLDIETINLNKNPSIVDSLVTPRADRPLNLGSQISNRSKQTYKGLYIQNIEDKLTKRNSILISHPEESFNSNAEEAFIRRKDKRLTVMTERTWEKPLRLENSNSLRNQERKDSNKELFSQGRNFSSNRNVIQVFNNKNEQSCNLLASNFIPGKRDPSSGKDKKTSNKELSYMSEAKFKSNKFLKQLNVFNNLVLEKVDSVCIIQTPKIKDINSIRINLLNSEKKKKKNSSLAKKKVVKKDEKMKFCREKLNSMLADKNNFAKKNLSKLIFSHKIYKEQKENSKDIFDYLYKSAETKQVTRNLYCEEFLKNNCTFSPKITRPNSNAKKENRDEFINRLVNSKKLNQYELKISKSALNLEGNSLVSNSCSNTPRLNSSRSKNPKASLLKAAGNIKECHTENSTYMLSNEDYVSSHSSRRYLNSSNCDKNLNVKLEKSFEKKKSIENLFKNDFTQKSNENISKFKLNNLKEIFEIIFNNCDNIEDIWNLDSQEISSNLKNRLIIPCCHLMKQRCLDFNFQNFYLIANEIMKTVI